MIHIEKDSRSIDSIVVTRTAEHWSGLPWDDGDLETVRYFKESGVFLTDEEVKKLETWLTDYAEMMYHNGKSQRLNEKQDINIARAVGEFLAEMRTNS
jgi:hypothetical protein